jgi:DNA-binding transcriptional MerR regulator
MLAVLIGSTGVGYAEHVISPSINNRLSILKELEDTGLVTKEEATEKRQSILGNAKAKPKVIADVTSPSMLQTNIATLKRTKSCPNCYLERANLQGAILRGSNLMAAKLYSADLQGANLREANLQGVDLSDANLKGANLQGANLKEAKLYYAELSGANLKGGNLQKAKLHGANLHGANLLQGTKLLGATLFNANFNAAKLNLEGVRIARASGAINIPEAVFVVEKKSKPKVRPVVTARKPSPPSPSAAEIENQKLRNEMARLKKQEQKKNEKLRKENARLKKQNQSQPKKVAKKKTQPKPSSKSATSGSGFFAYGNCNQEKVIKLIDTGFTKAEISKFCSTPSQPTQEVDQQAKPLPSKKVSLGTKHLSQLNGGWDLSANCFHYIARGLGITFTKGAVTGDLDFGADQLTLQGNVDENGVIHGYLTGMYVLGNLNGKITDWAEGVAEGELVASGEEFCLGKWTMTKKK